MGAHLDRNSPHPLRKQLATDEIILETRRIKEALAESMDYDLDRILKDAR